MTNFTKHMAKLNQIVHLIFGKNILDHGLISMFSLVGNSLLYLYSDARRFRKRDEHIFIASSYRFWLCEFLHGENEIYEFSCCNKNNQKHFELEIQFFSTGSFRQNSAINKLKNAEFGAHFQSDTHFIGIRQSILTTDWHIFCFLCAHILFPMLNATKYKIHDILDRVIDIDWKFPMHGIFDKKATNCGFQIKKPEQSVFNAQRHKSCFCASRKHQSKRSECNHIEVLRIKEIFINFVIFSFQKCLKFWNMLALVLIVLYMNSSK